MNSLHQDLVLELAQIIKDRRLKIFSNRQPFSTKQGAHQVRTQKIQTLKSQTFRSRPEALSSLSGIPPRTPHLNEEGQSFSINFVDRLVDFKGELGFNRLQYVPTHSGNPRSGSVDWVVKVNSLKGVVDSKTYTRWLRSGSAKAGPVPLDYLESRVKQQTFLNFGDHMSKDRSSRFFKGICSLHAQFFIIYRYVKELAPDSANRIGNLGCFLISECLKQGTTKPEAVESFLAQIEIVHRDEVLNEFQRFVKELPKPVQITLFRLRRSMFEDEWDCATLIASAAERMKKPPLIIDNQLEEWIVVFQRKFDSWLDQHPEFIVLSQKHSFNHSSSSLLATRKDGGGNREIHLLVGLHRLILGRASALEDVWGHLSSDIGPDELDCLLRQPIRQEIYDTTKWWMQVVKDRDLPYGAINAIFPEREPKGRTFGIPWVLPEVTTRPATFLLKRFLASLPETSRVAPGGSEDYFMHFKDTLSKQDRVRLDSDSSRATDLYSPALVEKVFDPALKRLPDIVRSSVCFCAHRGKTIGQLKRPRVFEKLCEQDQEWNIWLKPCSPEFNIRALALINPSSKGLPIEQYSREIRSKALKGPFILKSPTGSGKTTWFAQQPGAIITLPSIAQIVLVSQTLEYFDIAHSILHAGRDKPEKSSLNVILCTPAYARVLLGDNSKRFLFSDEGETPQEEIHLNTMWCLKRGRFFVVSSATPDLLRLPIPTLEIFGRQSFKIKDRETSYAELSSDVKSLVETTKSEQKVLVITYSEPSCIALAKKFGSCSSPSLSAHSAEETREVFRSKVIVATNKIRSAVTIPGLVAVFDLQRQYVYVTDKATGTVSGILCVVNKSQRQQARGRLGRVCDGTYFTVKSHLPANESQTAIMETESSVRSSSELCLPAFPLPMSLPSLTGHFIRNAMMNVSVSGSDFFKKKLPSAIAFASVSSSMEFLRKRITLMTGFKIMNLQQRLLELSRSSDEELVSVYERFKENLGREEICFAALAAIADLLRLRLYGREVGIICRWAKVACDESDIMSLLQSGLTTKFPTAKITLAILNWEGVFSQRGTVTQGCFKTWRTTKILKDGHYVAVAREIDYTSGHVKIVQKFELSSSEWSRVSELFERAKDLLSTVKGLHDGETNIVSHHVGLVGKKKTPRLGLLTRHLKDLEFQPGESTKVLDLIIGEIDRSANSTHNLTSGVNMASEISFPTLNSVCYLTALPLKRKYPSFMFEIFGDDFQGSVLRSELNGSDLLSEVSDNRAKSGAKQKDSASSTQKLKSTLTVMTERFIDGDGVEHQGLKPLSVYRLFAASRPDFTLIDQSYSLSDYTGIYNSVVGEWPFLSRIFKDPSTSNEKRSRSTLSRILAKRLLKTFETGEDLALYRPARSSEINNTISSIEERILLIQPSQRGEGELRPKRNFRSEHSSIAIQLAESWLNSSDTP